MNRVLEKFEVEFAEIIACILVFHHANQGFANVDRFDTETSYREGIIERLHNETSGDPAESFPFRVFAQFLCIDFFRTSFLYDFLSIVETQLGEQVTLWSLF